MGNEDGDCGSEFPVSGLLPRKETGVLNFLNKYPSYDGRGTIIAIFDSGVDPTAPGLQVTTENEVKVIDRIDASGAGDIDTSTVVESEVGKSITGLTGRTLEIPKQWNNPSKKYHLGVISVYNIYPTRLRERIVKERKEKDWDVYNRTFLSRAQRKIEANENSKSIDKRSQSIISSKASFEDEETVTPDSKSDTEEKSPPIGLTEKLSKENSLAEVSLLKSLDKKYNNVGPTFDVVVFHDGTCWRACIDNCEEGALENGLMLGEYRVTHECKILNFSDQYTVSVNVHNEGNLLELVGMCSSHGTHVASIASANFPDSPEKNGVAPGAKIVSITIGDNRLGSMETGTSLVRAMNRVMENPHYKVDVINMSYGEHGHWSNAGRLGEIAHEVVNKYGVVWVASAGNHGPALCTVGVPPDFFTDSIIGVGAYVSPEMMAAEYSLTEKLPGRPYTWSSRGPTADGGRGVSVCAPGGAITSVPKFTLRCNQLMNGTSMASPHTAGCVALLISALKLKKLPYTPYSIRRAVQNTATSLATDVFAQGHGLINVDKSLDYLVENGDSLEHKVRFNLECGLDRGKGIHVRNWDADKPVDVPVSVEPFIFDDTRADPKDKLAMNFEFLLTCEDSWVKFPSCLQLSYTCRAFKVILDPSALERGRAFFSCIRAYLADCPEKGPIFDIPITMVVPHTNLMHNYQFVIEPTMLKSGDIQRHFIRVPLEATYATVFVRASGTDKVQRFTLHTVQIKPLCSVTTLEFYKVLNLGLNESGKHAFAVKGGLTLEICLARWWSCLAEGQVEMHIQFHSLFCPQEMVSFATSDGFHRIDVKASLRSEEVSPQAVLKHHSQALLPSENKIEVLGGERDTLPDGRIIYQIVLTYNFTIAKAGAEVTPKCSLLNHVLYESSYESQLWMLFDCNKQLLCSGDALCWKYNCKLEKGSYTIRLHVRHDKIDLLEKLNDMPLTIITKLPQEVKVDMYTSYSAAVMSGKKVQSLTLPQGYSQPLYITSPNLSDKNLKSLPLSVGDCLLGSVSFSKDDNTRKADSYPLRVFVTELPCKKKPTGSLTPTGGSDDKKEFKTLSDYEEGLRDFKTSWIAKMDKETGERLYYEVTTANPDHLPALLSRLHVLDAATGNHTEEISNVSRQIISAIDVEALLSFYGTKTDSRQDATKIKTQMDRQKNILLEAWARLGNAIYSAMVGNGDEGPKSAEDLATLDTIASDIMKFVDPLDSKVINFFINYYQAKGFKALACRLMVKLYEDKPTKENDKQLIDIYSALDWCHVASLMRTIHYTKFPPSFARF